MNHILWILPLTFVFLASSLIWFIIGCVGAWWLKLIMMAITATLSVLEWQEIDNAFGYPKQSTLAALNGKEAVLYHMVIKEPEAIYLWMKVDGDDDLRAYQLPYTRSLAKQQQDDGSDTDPVHIRFGAPKKIGSDGIGAMVDGAKEFYVLPPPLQPPKVAKH
jgi:hypothetical protein